MGRSTWFDGLGRGLRTFARRMADDARGNVAMLFGLSLPVLILVTVGGVDIHRASTVRVNLQDALDAAALAAARSPYTQNDDLQRVGLASLRANLKAYPNITLREADTTFVLSGDEVVVASSKVDVKTLVANIFLPPYGKFMDDYLPVGAHSEVDRSSRNIEVSLVLDITGSMDGQRIIDLKAAAKDLVDLIVQPVQTPYYSKVALVPYSNSVNPGAYVAAARGPISTSVNITGAVINLAGTPKTITAATMARPVVITSSSHGFSNGDVVWISGASGMTQLNNKPFEVRNRTRDTFELYTLNGYRVDGRNYSTHTGNTGRVQRCQNNDCSITITADNHGLSNNDYVYITNVGGMTQINNETHLVGNVSTNSFTIDLTDAALTPYTSGGKAWSAVGGGTTYFAFENMNGDLQTHRVSGCVTERTGAEAYTEAAPSGASSRVGRHYPNIDGVCIQDTIFPLSSSAATIKARIDDFTVSGSTAGQIGIAWGWYMVSPNWNTLWPSSGAAAYNSARTVKAVVIMTDGEFNTPYCRGVISRQAGVGSGGNSAKIDCDATNGDPFTQSAALCTAMKNQGVIVYTVGFGITAGGAAATMLETCATTRSNFFLPANGGDLSEAFAAIGRDITQLRISR
ncbi:MAG: pilus assembly protein [Alphaproteobacteria bacterium]|jgi:Flp pilus assembly protein TadG|nr:pilus assembly protein [Alphaproteobacteria bacterium]MBU2042282.1 pilus assembly protein [Alphaproteobacteria bacterium]MBU2126958.1 pilus assembly protein [Alphaproteobacteria bacterium]MBU2207613.1 pilus assembly protein [Alphaproteobacteria bacterium]MBU2291130.1 pilus assembly protein [Alphaproteobacteria bacterium]